MHRVEKLDYLLDEMYDEFTNAHDDFNAMQAIVGKASCVGSLPKSENQQAKKHVKSFRKRMKRLRKRSDQVLKLLDDL